MKNYFVIFFLFISFVANAQNLITNNSFETISSCPPTLATPTTPTVSLANNWSQPTAGTSDVFNNCLVGGAGVPNNLLGSQAALTGNGYGGFFAYDGTGYSEYLQVQLDQPLIPGNTYCVSFNVSLADLMGQSIEEIGAYFSQNPINSSNNQVLSALTPQVQNNSGVLNNKTGWTTVSGTFVATSSHLYMTIGNFALAPTLQTETTTDVAYTNASYYYVDDVSVTGSPTLTVTGNSIVCIGDQITLNASGGLSNYIWTATGLTGVNTGQTLNTTPTATTIYTVTAQTADGCQVQSQYTVNVGNQVSADFTSTGNLCAGFAVSFADLSTGTTSGTSYAWDFDGDNITDATTNGGANFTYNLPGTYNVTLTIANGSSCSDQITIPIVITTDCDPCEDDNLFVTNFDFEQFTSCPTALDNIGDAFPWSAGNSLVPDYYNSCSATNGNNNVYGNQNASSGNGYAGFFAYQTDGSREYLSVPLQQTLTPGNSYCVEFKVSLADNSGIAVDQIGAYFSASNPILPTTTFLPYSPQVSSSTGFILQDKTNWISISGTFTATAADNFLTIGNFNNNVNTNTSTVVGISPIAQSAYYYVDEISVFEAPQFSLNTTASTICGGESVTMNAVGDYCDIFWTTANDPITVLSPTGQLIAAPTQTTTYFANSSNGSCAITEAITITVVPNPTPSFAFNNTCFGQATQFVSQSLNVSPTTVYNWDFNEDGIPEFSGTGLETVFFTFPTIGLHEVKLTLTDPTNACVTNNTPSALFLDIQPCDECDKDDIIVNSSFDNLDISINCPNNLGEINNATPWTSATNGTPDLFNFCSFPATAGIPNNQFGIQTPNSGLGYAGFEAYNITGDREYITVPLSNTLVPGNTYCVSFQVSLAENSNFSITEIGAYLSDAAIFSPTNGVISGAIPQVESTMQLTNMNGWVNVTGNFTATSANQFLTIGNFNDNNNTTAVNTNNGQFTGIAYYYIDDVVVTEYSVSLTTPAVSCPGDLVSLTANVDGLCELSWAPADNPTNIVSIDPTFFATPLITTDYIFTAESECCIFQEVVTVTVSNESNSNAGPDFTICPGESIILNGSGSASNIYQWSPNLFLNNATIAQPTAMPPTTTTYTLSAIDQFGCTTTDDVTVTVDSIPVIQVTQEQTICAGDQVQLMASGGNGATYNWSPANGLSSTLIPNPIASPAITTAYQVTVTSPTGCVGTANVTVIVNPIPTFPSPWNYTICAGSSITFTDVPQNAQTYSWFPPVNLSCTNCANPTATPNASEIYELTYVDSLGCTGSVTYFVTVIDLLLLEDPANINTTICEGSCTPLFPLNLPPGVSATWGPPATLDDPTSSTPIACPLVTTEYTLTITDPTGLCTVTDTKTVFVDPTINANAGLDVTICEGGSVQMNASGGVNYLWTPALGISDPNISNPIANPTTTTTYIVEVEGGTNCVAFDSVTVFVEPQIVLDPIGPFTICQGENVQLVPLNSGTPGTNWLWTPDFSISSITAQNPIVSPNTTTVYTVTNFNGNPQFCAATQNVTVNVIEFPLGGAGNDVAVCEGDFVVLNAFGGTGYSWSPSIGLSNATISNPIASPMTTTNYTVSITANGCTIQDDITVFVSENITVDAGPDQTICLGESTQLIATGGPNYFWSPSTGLSSTTIPNPTVSPLITTTYQVISFGANALACSDTDYVTIMVDPLTTLLTTPGAEICAGDSVQLQASGASTYNWFPTTGLSNATIADPIAFPTQTTVYTVQATNGGASCLATQEITIVVEAQPEIMVINEVVNICEGESVQIGATGDPGLNYAWTPAASLINPNTANPIASPTITTLYDVVANFPGGSCIAFDKVVVNVDPIPFIFVGQDVSVCTGGSYQVDADVSGAAFIQWSPTTGVSNPNIANPIITPTGTATYTVVATNANQSCTFTDELEINVEPQLSANAGPDQTICNGSALTLQGSGGTSYSWSPSTGLSSSTIANPLAAPAVTTTYTLTVSNGNADVCSDADQVTITVENAVNLTVANNQIILCEGESLTLEAFGATNYSWTPNVAITGANTASPIVTPTSTTIYTVSGSNAFGNCVETQNIEVIVIPSVDATISSNQTICLGEQATLNATGGSNYSWSPANGLSATNIPNPIASPTQTTNYIVSIDNGNVGCAIEQSVLVEVEPNVTLTVSEEVTICEGESAQIFAISNADNFLWTPATGLDDPTSANPFASPTITTTYIVSAFNGAGICDEVASVTVNVNPTVTNADAGPDVTICEGEQVQLFATGGTNFSWTPTTGISGNVDISSPFVSPNTTTVYTVSSWNSTDGSCAATDEVTVSVNAGIDIIATEDQTICIGENVTLTANGGMGVSYLWNGPAGTISNANNQTVTVTPTIEGPNIYEVTATSANGACEVSEFINVIVIDNGLLDAGPDQNVCFGESAILTVIGGASDFVYNWSPATGLNTTTGSSVVLTSASNDITYTVTGNSPSSPDCITTDEVTVNVIELPQLQVTPDVVEICEGDNVAITASGASSYTWNPSSGLSATDIANPIASPAVTTNYQVIGFDSTGECAVSEIISVVVNEFPNSLNVFGSDTVCAGEIAFLNATGADTYSWEPANLVNNPTIASPVAAPTNTTTYTVLASNADSPQCAISQDFTVTVLGQNEIFLTNDFFSICAGDNVQLSATGATNFSWFPSNGLSNSNIASPIASPTQTTTYTVTSENIFGDCPSFATVTIEVTDVNSVIVGPDQVICSNGDGVELFVSGGTSYLWSPATGLSDATIANPIANPLTTTQYTVEVNNGNSDCTITETVNVVVENGINLQVSPSQQVCNGDPIQLNALGAATYLWSPATGLSNINIANPIATPAVTTTYTVTGFSVNGLCSTSQQITLEIGSGNSTFAGQDHVICEGGSAQLNAVGGTNFNWFPITGLSSNIVANPIATPTVTTVYNVVSYIGNSPGFCSDTDQVVVFVEPATNVFANPTNISTCVGEPIQLSATGATNYVWSPATGLNNANIANPILTPSLNTVYTVTGSNGPGTCVTTDQVTVNILGTSPIISAGSDMVICAGQTTQLSATGGSNYTWFPTTGLSNPNISNPIASPTETTIYNVFSANGSCSDTDQVIIFVNELDLNISNDITICEGETIQLSVFGADSYQWTPSTGLDNPFAANPLASPATSTTYTVTGTITNGSCTSSQFVTVNVNPTLTANAGSDVTVCSGETVQLNASGGATYSWFPPTGLNNPNISNPVLIANSNITYSVTVTGGLGSTCTDTDEVSVNVGQGLNVQTSGDVTICNGESANLFVSGGVNYTWSPATGLSNPNIPNPIATPNSTTTYTVNVSNFDGTCTETQFITVSVVPTITANAGADQMICLGETTQLNASGGVTYSWSPTFGLSNPNIPNPIISPTSTTTYVVTVSGGVGSNCVSTDQVLIEVSQQPSVQVSPDVSICDGESTSISAFGALNYTWSPNIGLSNSNISNPVASPTTTTTYTVTGDFGGNTSCNSTAFVTVNVVPDVVANAGSDQSICLGETVQLNATGGSIYSWSPTIGLSNPNIPNPIVSATSTITYVVTVSGGFGSNCVDSDEVLIEVSQQPSVQVSPDVSICEGESVNLSAFGALNYTWSPNIGLSNPNVSNPVASPTATTTYTVTGDFGGNASCNSTAFVTVNVVPNIVANAGVDQSICLGETVQLNAIGGSVYSWTPTIGLSNPNIANPIVSPSSTITYFVSVSGGINSNCISTDEVTINVTQSPDLQVSNDVNICSGESTQLFASGGTNYTWSPTEGLSNPNIANPLANPAITTTYVVTSNIAGNTNCDAVGFVTVNVSNTLVTNAGNDQTICSGSTAQLNATGGAVYSWFPTIGLSNPNIANPIVSPAATTTYTVTVSGGINSNCSASDQVTIEVVPAVNLSVSNNESICSGEFVQLFASGATNYTWLPTTGLSNPNVANPVASPSTTTTYTVTANIGGNTSCAQNATVTVNVGSLTSADAGNNFSVCSGESVQLNGTGGGTYLWSPAIGLSNPNIANPIATPAGSITYTLTTTSGNNTNCTSSDQVTITVIPASSVQTSNNESICVGGSVQLSAFGASNYTWFPTTGLNNANIANPIATPNTTTTYTVTANNGFGNCNATGTVTVTVGGSQTANAGNDATICAGESAQLIASGGTFYTWFPTTGLSNPNIANPIANPITSTNYTVTVSDNSTGSCSSSDQVSVVVDAASSVQLNASTNYICQGDPVTLTATGNSNIVWNGGTITGITQPSVTVTPFITTTYTVTGNGTTGACSSTDFVTIVVDDCYQPLTASLGSQVFEDTNGNGFYDFGEPLVSGVQVILYNANDLSNPINTMFTDFNGEFLFTNLTPGVGYVVSFILPNGFEFTSQGVGASAGIDGDSDVNPITGNTGIIILSNGETNLTIDAGIMEEAVVGCTNPLVLTQCVEPLNTITVCPDFCALFGLSYDIINVDNLFDCSIEFEDGNPCFEYTPLPGFDANDTLIIEACTLNGTCDIATVVIPVELDCGFVQNPDNYYDLIAEDDFEDINDIDPILIDVLLNDDAANSYWLQITSICTEDADVNGYVDIVNNQILYQPSDENFVATEEICYTVCNDFGCDEATLYLNIDSSLDNSATIDANDDLATTEGEMIEIDILENDDATILNPGLININDEANNGTVDITAEGTINYTPNDDFSGVETFTYIICDENNNCDEATITVEVRITEMAFADWFNVYPIPATDVLNIELSTGEAANVVINLYNIAGELIKTNKVVATENFVTHQYNLKDLPKGVYSVVVDTNNQRISKQIVKQ